MHIKGQAKHVLADKKYPELQFVQLVEVVQFAQFNEQVWACVKITSKATDSTICLLIIIFIIRKILQYKLKIASYEKFMFTLCIKLLIHK